MENQMKVGRKGSCYRNQADKGLSTTRQGHQQGNSEEDRKQDEMASDPEILPHHFYKKKVIF